LLGWRSAQGRSEAGLAGKEMGQQAGPGRRGRNDQQAELKESEGERK